jgi:hypothetical protein
MRRYLAGFICLTCNDGAVDAQLRPGAPAFDIGPTCMTIIRPLDRLKRVIRVSLKMDCRVRPNHLTTEGMVPTPQRVHSLRCDRTPATALVRGMRFPTRRRLKRSIASGDSVLVG